MKYYPPIRKKDNFILTPSFFYTIWHVSIQTFFSNLKKNKYTFKSLDKKIFCFKLNNKKWGQLINWNESISQRNTILFHYICKKNIFNKLYLFSENSTDYIKRTNGIIFDFIHPIFIKKIVDINLLRNKN